MSATFEWNGHLAKERVRRGAVNGLRRAAENLKEASNKAAPKETSHLVESSGTDVDAAALVASVYYAPTAPPNRGRSIYAIVRHEAVRQGGAPKYLERPMLAYRRKLAADLAAAIRQALG